ncbi:phosphofurin acidic cluster sorting protein 2-like protein [Lates japonicus]|uniref:Phosphofurin acidic cluster sorting protein 2-like protein n=1 Tax=Lates japonicus TaxID=270547 RepID=A0AAD3MLP9_LATJO|nr:phosphofurin acidic cluster sorting protein 2-like protein [Lates japonicus]
MILQERYSEHERNAARELPPLQTSMGAWGPYPIHPYNPPSGDFLTVDRCKVQGARYQDDSITDTTVGEPETDDNGPGPGEVSSWDVNTERITSTVGKLCKTESQNHMSPSKVENRLQRRPRSTSIERQTELESPERQDQQHGERVLPRLPTHSTVCSEVAPEQGQPIVPPALLPMFRLPSNTMDNIDVAGRVVQYLAGCSSVSPPVPISSHAHLQTEEYFSPARNPKEKSWSKEPRVIDGISRLICTAKHQHTMKV